MGFLPQNPENIYFLCSWNSEAKSSKFQEHSKYFLLYFHWLLWMKSCLSRQFSIFKLMPYFLTIYMTYTIILLHS